MRMTELGRSYSKSADNNGSHDEAQGFKIEGLTTRIELEARHTTVLPGL